MNRNKNYFWLLTLLLFSCREDGFKDLENEIKQKIVQLATGEMALSDASHFAATIEFGKANHAPIHQFTLYHHNLSRQTIAESSGDTLDYSFKKILLQMKEGEKCIFLLPFSYFDDTFLSAFADSSIAAKDELMQITIHILKTFGPGELAGHLMSMAQHGEISESNAIEWLLMNDTSADYERQGDIFIQRIREGGSLPVQPGDTVLLTYNTSFLDGKLIDRTTQMEYLPGQTGQLVNGLAAAVKSSHCGDSIKVYIPSSLTFGEAGSSTGIIPPKTPLLFSVAIECN